MQGKLVPQILRHAIDRSITLSHHKPKYSLLWLHGLGDEAETYLPYFAHLQSPLYHHCRIKLLQAPKRFTTINQEENNAWFDMRSAHRFNTPENQMYDLNQLDQTSHLIAAYCKEEE